MTLVVEALHLIYLLRSKVVTKKLDRYFETYIGSTYIVYIMLKMVSMLDMSERFRQLYIGMTMAAILVLLLVVEIVYAFGVFGLLFGSVVKHCVGLFKSKKNTSKTKM